MVHGLQLIAGQSGDQVEVCGASDAGEGDISSSRGEVGTVNPEKGLLDHGTLGFTDRHRIGWAEGKSGSALSVFTNGGNRVREDHATIGQAQDAVSSWQFITVAHWPLRKPARLSRFCVIITCISRYTWKSCVVQSQKTRDCGGDLGRCAGGRGCSSRRKLRKTR